MFVSPPLPPSPPGAPPPGAAGAPPLGAAGSSGMGVLVPVGAAGAAVPVTTGVP